MIGKSVWRLTYQHICIKNKLSVCRLPRLSNASTVCPSARPRFSSSAPLLLRVNAGERWSAQCVPQRLCVLENLKTSSCSFTSQAAGPSEVPFEELEDLANANKCRIIDVREPDELQQTGRIGQAINIPVGEIGDALKMSEDAFNSKYGITKPDSEADVVLYCRAGVRSKKALDTAHALGYTKIKHFPGGWMEWATQKGLPV